jgi:thymidine kinase
MPKLYFKYGAMGSSKTAQALMCKYNYNQKGFNVWLIKPVVDNRYDVTVPVVQSRIGIKSECETFSSTDSLIAMFNERKNKNYNVIIVDECQFSTEQQIDELKELSEQVPVLCYGLKTNYKTKLFEGSKRLLEIADSITEIKSVCKCGRKATINVRFNNGKIVTDGEEVVIGGDETYEGVCYCCYKKLLKEDKNA